MSWLQGQWPEVIYRVDLAADMKLTRGQAMRHKFLHPVRGYPDLTILAPRGQWHGLFVELKADGVTVHKRNGELKADEHLHEQAAMMARLQAAGYRTEWGLGYEATVALINAYLTTENPSSPERRGV